MSEEETPWWKKPWVWFAGIATVLGGALVFVLTFGKKGGRVQRPDGLGDKPPERPELPGEPVIPKAPDDVSTTPKDDYERDVKDVDDVDDVVSDLNDRFK